MLLMLEHVLPTTSLVSAQKSYLSAAFPADVEMVLGKHLDAARNLRA
jgi:hypothetical protein